MIAKHSNDAQACACVCVCVCVCVLIGRWKKVLRDGIRPDGTKFIEKGRPVEDQVTEEQRVRKTQHFSPSLRGGLSWVYACLACNVRVWSGSDRDFKQHPTTRPDTIDYHVPRDRLLSTKCAGVVRVWGLLQHTTQTEPGALYASRSIARNFHVWFANGRSYNPPSTYLYE